ncbi:hypothetical protein B0H15DRAFT_914426 [Mycena belliarum]|uniref:SAM domain-containing protein n=1 Tax=Mycena belliarum TaxID=1033014 RepID=A0AAD6TT68_9AGAR|nr:hypothetical protein B0H15DRAFT_914426 [Mycena belliae]
MSSQPSSPKPQFASAERQPPSSRLAPLPSPRPTANGFVPPSPRFASGPGGKPEGEGLDEWIEDLSKYEATLEAMAEASVDVKFKEELGTIEQWFKVLSEAERTAALYTLLQHSNQGQIRFLIAVLQQMAGPAGSTNGPLPASLDGSTKTTQSSGNRNLRPPSLNIPLPRTPATPQFTPLSARLQSQIPDPTGQDIMVNRSEEGSWANMVNTPLVPMFQKAPGNKNAGQNNMALLSPSMFPGGMINPMMLNNMALSNEAQLNQLLAVQMMMSGMSMQQQPNPQNHQKPQSAKPHTNNWRSPASARYPGSALRSSGLKSAGPKSSGLKSASSLGSATTPREEDIDPELLKDVPAWLRSLRLHKYTQSFEGMTWQEMVVLDEPTLEAKGIAALGARRRLLKTFDNVKRKMGMEGSDASTPTAPPASALLPSITHTSHNSPPDAASLVPPHSAAP